ncbi:hypothetical protein C0991_007099 [Blastosporella zonata]|nr:hypothetical protein C0991_007099 [Blastosporella zonata]
MKLPPLPKIEGDTDIILDVYTHDSLRFAGTQMNDDYGDTKRLAELGSRILDLAVTSHFFSKRPLLQAHEIAEQSRLALADDKLESWLESYGLKFKLRYAPGEEDKISTPSEIRHFFNTYIGALYIRNGSSTIQDWISQLIDPEEQHVPTSQWAQPTQDTSVPAVQSSYRAPALPSQPPHSPPPLPVDNSPMIGVGTTFVSSLVSLALVNQTAAQRGVTVTYPAEQAGPPHMPIWTVRCLSKLQNMILTVLSLIGTQ